MKIDYKKEFKPLYRAKSERVVAVAALFAVSYTAKFMLKKGSAAIADVRKKKAAPALEGLRLETFAEGRCAQILHVGPFTEEGPTVERSSRTGKHHEIYLSDIRRAAPAKWKTIIRQPMR